MPHAEAVDFLVQQVGLSRETFGVPYETLIKEYEELPLKDSVVEKWLYGNAAHFFRLG